jgi:hypothetical protein
MLQPSPKMLDWVEVSDGDEHARLLQCGVNNRGETFGGGGPTRRRDDKRKLKCQPETIKRIKSKRNKDINKDSKTNIIFKVFTIFKFVMRICKNMQP